MNMIVEIDEFGNINIDVTKTLMTSGGPYSSDVICLTIQHLYCTFPDSTRLMPKRRSL